VGRSQQLGVIPERSRKWASLPSELVELARLALVGSIRVWPSSCVSHGGCSRVCDWRWCDSGSGRHRQSKLTGVQGHDYGTRLYLVDKSAHPLWAAGRYRPGLRELDCVGIVLEQWTSGAIQFRLGSGHLQGHYPQLDACDFVQIVWNHLTVGVHVKYGSDGVPPGS